MNIAKKDNENFKIKGNLKNSEAHIDPKVLSEILKTNFDILSTEKVLISSNNEFEFHYFYYIYLVECNKKPNTFEFYDFYKKRF